MLGQSQHLSYSDRFFRGNGSKKFWAISARAIFRPGATVVVDSKVFGHTNGLEKGHLGTKGPKNPFGTWKSREVPRKRGRSPKGSPLGHPKGRGRGLHRSKRARFSWGPKGPEA